MNIFVFSTFFLAVFLTEHCNAEYSVQGNHWGEGKSIKNLNEYAETMITEWENMVANKDAEDMVKKYTDDCVYVWQGSPTAYGREEAKKLYQAWFESGVESAKVDLLRAGALGHGYIYLLESLQSFDKNKKHLENSTMLVIFKEVDDGFETFLKSQTID